MEQKSMELINQNLKYLQLLSRQFPNISSASREIINLQAILNLPKGTEHFLSDLHGEFEAFLHILKNASGVIRRKIEDVFGAQLRQHEKRSLATLIYYPEEVLNHVEETEPEVEDWYEISLHRLVLVCREVSSKYTRSKVRKALPKDFDYIIEELLHEQENAPNKTEYYDEIIKTIIRIGQAKPFIIAICELIQRLAIDHLHIIGDIYDRGPGADIIIEKLITYHTLDIQWGNHDIGWMGAAAGSLVCIANIIRLCARYGNLNTLEDSYGINLFPLAKFAHDTYSDYSPVFHPRSLDNISSEEIEIVGKMHKAISIIQFKLEGQLVQRNPDYGLDHRLLLDKIDYEKGTIIVDGKQYDMLDMDFPTVDPLDPYALTPEEQEVMSRLRKTFLRNEKLHRHMDLFLSRGSMYLVFNGNLLLHGCIPMDAEGNFQSFTLDGETLAGKELLDKFDQKVRESFENRYTFSDNELDFYWYLYTGEKSSVFGKKRITTFERYFIDDTATHHEEKNEYYTLIQKKETCEKVLAEFGLTGENCKIINGHVPVKVRKGESPIKAEGKLLVIDGGLSRAYQKDTGIAGYTLIYNSYGMILAAHEAFESKQKAILEDEDIISKLTILKRNTSRIRVGDTDIGVELKKQIKDLELLLLAYKKGIVKQNI